MENLPQQRAQLIRLVVVTREPALRRGLLMCFAAEPDLSVVGNAEDSVAALRMVRDLRPDVVLVEAAVAGGHAPSGPSEYRRLCQQVRVVLLGAGCDRRGREQEETAYVDTALPVPALLTAIRSAARASTL